MPVPAANLRPILEATRSAWESRLDELFARGQFILGDQVANFEREWADYLGAKFALGVGNGTDAITLALRDAQVTGEVLTTALTAPFTGVGILASGAKIKFADINPETLSIDFDDAANRVTKRTAALVPVHLYGQPCRIDLFAKLARQRKLTLIQDAAQAHGSKFHGRRLSEFSPYVTYSFYPTKNLGCLGDGGAIVTSSPAIHKRLRQMRDGGRRGGQISYGPGINSRLDEMQACYLRSFLPRLDDWNADRARTAALYDQALAGVPGVRLLKRYPCSVCHLYVIRAERRDKLREHLAKLGIGTGIHYPVPMHLHPAFASAGQKKGSLPHAERAAKEILSLPLWPYLLPSQVAEVAEAIRKFYA
ncbi:MAG: DegT/DnrJ/EryC1/StrS family aminotransferase [Bryobacteraceae bacterium]|nr:DegT/DnrJ/EryC1/StrS family aminotransferase [Bryobacteraceae bacterium]